MTCAKQTVTCTLVTPDGDHIVGTNYCLNPQAVCPRALGEGYDKCASICQQLGHAEEVALSIAGDRAKGSQAYSEGHTHACIN
jgi:deoxycytidylate deaminase